MHFVHQRCAFAIAKICFSIICIVLSLDIRSDHLPYLDRIINIMMHVRWNQVIICMHRVISCCTSTNPRHTRPPCRKFRPRDLRGSGQTGVRYISRGPSRWGRNCTRETWRRSPCPRGRLYVPECTCDARRVRRRTLSLRVTCKGGLFLDLESCVARRWWNRASKSRGKSRWEIFDSHLLCIIYRDIMKYFSLRKGEKMFFLSLSLSLKRQSSIKSP